MAAQKGREILLKVGDGGGSEIFTTIAGLRAKSIKLGESNVDVTNADSPNAWRELLEGAGIKNFSVSGSGVFKDSASEETVRSLKFAGTHRNWQIIIPNFGIIQAKCQITDLEYTGNHDGEATYSLTLESAGEPTWTPV
jgi:TP901-1 family phage major tail protein